MIVRFGLKIRRRRMVFALIGYACIGISLQGRDAMAEERVAANSASIHAPPTVLAGDPISIRVDGLPPRMLVRLSATRVYGRQAPKMHRSSAVFRANGNGEIDTAIHAPVSGLDSSYEGIEPIGLLWSMKPTSEEEVQRPEQDEVEWTATLVEDRTLVEDSSAVAMTTTIVRRRAEGLTETALSDDPKLQGSFVLRDEGQTRLPVVILLGGSEGGDFGARASASGFASRGFAAVGVPYYSPAWGNAEPKFDRLPTAFVDIPIDRLERVRDSIEARDDLDENRVGVMGVSKGAEFALLAAERFDWIDAVCAIVPSDVVWEGWGDNGTEPRSCFSWQGKPLPFVPYEGMQTTIAKMQAGEPATLREPHEAGRLRFADRVEPARIRVENISGAVMLVGGDQDPTWNSGEMARNIVASRLAAGKKTEAWISPLAGHYLAGHAYRPMETPEGSLRSKTYPAMLDFFRRRLHPRSHD